MTGKSFVVAMLAASGFIATPHANAEHINVDHYYVGDYDDDDRDEWQERRKRKKAKKHKYVRKHVYHRYYAYDRPPAVIYAPPESATRKAPSSPSGSFPRESAADQATAKDRQRELLQKELADEQELAADARARLDQPSVQHHERNVEALRRELRNLQR